jgi:hypothetical protein
MAGCHLDMLVEFGMLDLRVPALCLPAPVFNALGRSQFRGASFHLDPAVRRRLGIHSLLPHFACL